VPAIFLSVVKKRLLIKDASKSFISYRNGRAYLKAIQIYFIARLFYLFRNSERMTPDRRKVAPFQTNGIFTKSFIQITWKTRYSLELLLRNQMFAEI